MPSSKQHNGRIQTLVFSFNQKIWKILRQCINLPRNKKSNSLKCSLLVVLLALFLVLNLVSCAVGSSQTDDAVSSSPATAAAAAAADFESRGPVRCLATRGSSTARLFGLRTKFPFCCSTQSILL